MAGSIDFCLKYYSVISTLIILIICVSNIYLYFRKCEKCPTDFELKNLDECYITLQNLIKFDVTNETKSDVKTYIYSATKPFLIELLQNATNDCVCSQNYYNEHLNDF